MSAPTSPRRKWSAGTRWFGRLPRSLRVGVVLVLALGVASAAYYWRVYRAERAAERAVAARWREFDDATRATDVAAMRAAVGRVLAVNPDDRAALLIQSALDSGSAD